MKKLHNIFKKTKNQQVCNHKFVWATVCATGKRIKICLYCDKEETKGDYNG